MKESFRQSPKVESISENRTKFESQLNNLLLSGAPLMEIAEILGAKEYIEGDPKRGVRLRVRDFANAQFGEQGSVNANPSQQEQVSQPVRLPDKFLKLNIPILPPGDGQIRTGSDSGYEEKKTIPRNLEFIRILTEIKEPYQVISGTNTKEMLREETYRIFLLLNRQKLVFVNDEEGNATFVVHDVASDWADYASLTKDKLKELPDSMVQTIIYPGSLEEWRVAMREVIEKEINKEKVEIVKPEETPIASDSEGNAEVTEAEEITRQPSDREYAPEGWLTNHAFSRNLNKDSTLIVKIASLFRKSNPEWFSTYLSNNGKPAEHYHPDLVAKIIEELGTRPESAPEGWMTKSALRIMYKKGDKLIRKIVSSFRENHPDWFQVYLDKIGKPAEHYHPDLVAKIIEELGARPESAPEGWMTNTLISDTLNVGEKIIKEITYSFRINNPEWFHVYLDKSNKPAEHYHPDLVTKIIEELGTRPESAPEGWITNKALARELGMPGSQFLIREVAGTIRTEHPEWFHLYLDKSNKPAEHYHPDLVAKIIEELGTRPESAPEGWMSTNALAKSLGLSFYFALKIADSFREDHPDWFEKYLDKMRKPVEHYHPDLIIAIKEKVERSQVKAPQGWKVRGAIAAELEKSVDFVTRVTEKFRNSNPEWFADYSSGGKVWEYYHPDLIKKIREEVAQTPPEGWATQSVLVSVTNSTYFTISKIANKYKISNPEWFKNYTSKSGKVVKHYHPDLVFKIKEELKS